MSSEWLEVHVGRKRGKRGADIGAKASGESSERFAARLRISLVIAAVALLVASVMLPSEGAVREGTYAPLAAGWCVLGLLWATSLLLTPQTPIRFGWFEIAGATFVGWHTLAGIAWLGSGHDRQTLNAIWLFIGYGLTAFLLRQLIQTAPQARALVVVMIAIATALSVVGYDEYFVAAPAVQARYKANPERMLSENRIPLDPDSPERQRFESRLMSVEPLTTFGLTNSLAGFLTPWLLVTLGIGLAMIAGRNAAEGVPYSAGNAAEGVPYKAKAMVAVGLVAVAIAGCLLLTKSRTATLACGTGVVLLLLYGRRGVPGAWRIGWRLPAMAVAVLTLIGLAVVYVGGLDAEVLSEAPKSVLYRLEYWRSTAVLIADYPLLGCGPGNFQETYAAYKLPQASETVADPHNFLLEIWATAGTPGLLLLLATIAGLAIDLMQASRGQSQQQLTNPPPVGPRAIYFGAGLGLLVGAVFAAIVGFPLTMHEFVPLPSALLIGVPILGLICWLLDGWAQRGVLPLGTLLVAAIALSINLLAAGAVVFPGVMASALALAPLALTISHTSTSLSPSPCPLFATPRIAAGLLAFALLLTIACLWTEYRPVINGRLKMDEALAFLQVRRPESAQEAALAAAAADPWWAEPWRLAAELRHQEFISTGELAAWQAFSQAAEEFRRRNPRHHTQHFQRGHWQLTAWRKTSDRKYLDQAMDAYRSAIARFPSHALYHAQLAWTFHLAGDKQAAADEADVARRLDEANPHADQKLRNFHLLDPRNSAGRMEMRRPETAEQTIDKLRIASSPENEL